MMYLAANNGNSVMHFLAGRYPGKIGMMMSPASGFSQPKSWMPYAIDNGKYSAWQLGRLWDDSRFFEMLDKCRICAYKPIWIVAPDEVGCWKRTESLWYLYEPRLRDYKFDLAYVAQDGAAPKSIPASADVIFIGGTTKWKWENAKRFCESFPRVHIGRVNSAEKLEYCEKIGAESCDGSGFTREGADSPRIRGLMNFLEGYRALKTQPLLC